MDSTQLLAEVGEILFGPRWRIELAAALDVSERTFRRWSNGTADIPSGAWADMRRMLAERGRAIADLDKRLAEL